jgi:cell division protein FtsZ
MKDNTDSLILLDNEKLSEYVPQLPIGKAFSVMDQIICETIKGLSETVTKPSIINIDYANLETVLEEGGVSVMLIGDTKDYDNVDLVDKTLEHPLIETDYKNAKSCLIHITCGSNISLDNINEVADGIADRTELDGDVVLGTRVDESYKNKVKIIAILTNVESENIVNKSENEWDDDSFDSLKSDVLKDNDIDTIE